MTTRFESLRLRIAIVVVLLGVLSPVGLRSIAQADTIDDVSTTLELLGVENPDDALVDQIAELVTEDDLEPPEETALAEQLRTRLQLWRDLAPEWREVDAALMIRVRECREDPDAQDCEEPLRQELRLRHAERVMERIEQRLAEADALSDDARTARIAALEMIMERVQTRVTEMARLSDEALGSLAGDRALMLQIQERIQVRIQQRATQTSTSTPSPTGSAPGGQDQSPGGDNGSGPDQSAPNQPSSNGPTSGGTEEQKGNGR